MFNPVWSPDGQRLAFEGNGDHGSHLWVANADGTDAHQVTATPDGCPDATCTESDHAAWSPDGASIAYMALTHVRGTFVENALTILDVATGTTTALYTTADVLLARPTWSPDGASIAFEIDRYEGVPDVSAMTSSVIAVIATGSPNPVPKEITRARAAGRLPDLASHR